MGNVDWSIVLEPLITAAVVSTAIVFLLRTWITERLRQSIKAEYDAKLADITNRNNAELERLKAELSRESARDIERIKGETARELESFKQRVTLLASRQAESSIELLKLLARLNSSTVAASNRTIVASNHEHVRNDLWNGIVGVQDFLLERGLIFPRELIPLANVFVARALELHASIAQSAPTSISEEDDSRRMREAADLGTTELIALTDQLRNLLQGIPLSSAG